MNASSVNRELTNFSISLTEVIELFSPERYSIENLLFRKLDKQCDKLQYLTNKLIKILDEQPFENTQPFESFLLFSPFIDLMKNIKLKPKSEKEIKILRKYSSTTSKFSTVLNLLSDFIEALDQYFDDMGKYKISYYLQLIDEYKQDRNENLKLAKEFIHIDLEGWE